MLKRSTAGILLILAALVAAPAGAGEKALSFADSKALAESKKALLLVKFGAEWCGPCKAFTADVAGNSEIQKSLEPVILCDIDAEKGEGIELAKTYEIQGFPTFILMNQEGQVVDRWMGYGGPADFGKTLAADIEDPTPIEVREQRFAASPNAKDAERLGRVRSSRGDYAGAVELYTKAKELEPEKAPEHLQNVFMAQYSGMRTKDFTYDQVKATADQILATGKATPENIGLTAMIMTSLARSNETPEQAVPYLTAAYTATSTLNDDPDVKQIRVDHAMLVLKDPAKAVELKRAAMPEGWLEDAGRLNDFSWWCFENKVNLDEALVLARKGVELAKPGKEKAMILDTAAEICLAKGGCKDAVDLAEAALKEDPDNKYYAKQLERFQKELAEATK